ncbi:ankyrin repeat-containing domain, PGG domain protein [Tanacetum coccineum]
MNYRSCFSLLIFVKHGPSQSDIKSTSYVALKIVKSYPALGTANGNILGVLVRKPESFREPNSNFFQKTISWAKDLYSKKNITDQPSENGSESVPENLVQEAERKCSIIGKTIKAGKHLYSSSVEKTIKTGKHLYSSSIIGKTIKSCKHHCSSSIIGRTIKSVSAVIASKVVPPEKNDEALQLLKFIWNEIAKKPKKDIDFILRGPGTKLTTGNVDHAKQLFLNEVEAMIPPSYREKKNKDGLTPLELFTEEHKELVTSGERWMKETANQCMVVAALIATIVFAAAFTVPGGYDQTSGIPIFHSKATFMVFVVADVISLFSSTTSILIFLSILTSRYAERDFLVSLLKKLMTGLASLFLSITIMTVAFSSSYILGCNMLCSLMSFSRHMVLDDYKLVMAINQGRYDGTLVQILSLKSNVWKLFGHVNYSFYDNNPGILFNGALHWFWSDANDNYRKFIMCFDLAKEEFREIPQPEDPRYDVRYSGKLGIFEDHLCIFHARGRPYEMWVMKNYNVKQSWELLPTDWAMKERLQCMKKDWRLPPKTPSYFCSDKTLMYLSSWGNYMSDPIFVQTLVSPYVNDNERPSVAKNNKRTVKSARHKVGFAYAGKKKEIDDSRSREREERRRERGTKTIQSVNSRIRRDSRVG